MKVEMIVHEPRNANMPKAKYSMAQYGTAGSAGLDLRANIPDTLKIYSGERLMIPSGISIHLHDTDVAAMILPRSGLGNRGLVLGNLVGLIDADYQGELMISAWNRNTTPEGFIEVKPGDRIAQLVIMPVIHPIFEVVAQFTGSTERGTNGFGSTGKE